MDYQIKNTTSRILNQIWNNGTPNKAVLAALRDSRSILSKKATVVWPIMLSAMNGKYLSRTGKPTKEEQAVFAALHCFAVFQQGKSQFTYEQSGENLNGLSLFSALAKLRTAEQNNIAIDRRIQNTLGTTNFSNVTNSLNQLIRILKSKATTVTIDFAELSQDLYFFQMSSEAARRVCLKWGQQYFAVYDKNKEK